MTITSIIGSIIPVGKVTWENRKWLKTYIKTKFGTYRNKDIRFSISYLFKIKIPKTNRYLLVMNRRIDNQLQPVGGAYRRFGDDSLFHHWGYKPDNKKNGLGVDEESGSDLRFMIRGKYVTEVMNWFEKENEREISPNREFKEELLDNKILEKTIFENLNYKKIRRFSKNLYWSKFFHCYEVLIYDIFELLPDDNQKKMLKELDKKGLNIKDGYAIVEGDDIEQLRLVRYGKQIARIGEHTKLLINKNF